MKWMLLVLIFGTIPVKTDLLFDSIEECLKSEEQMRNEYARVYNDWRAWAEANPKEAHYPDIKSSCGGATAWRRRRPASRMPSLLSPKTEPIRAIHLDNAPAFC
jgi:hypothetical protein